MEKVKIKFILAGHLPSDFQYQRILTWKSDLFEIVNRVENYTVPVISETYDLRKYDFRSQESDWEFPDEVFRQHLPDNTDSDFLLAVTNVPLEKHHSARRLGNNKVITTFFGLTDTIERHNIPLENHVLRSLYNYTLVYLRCGRTLPGINEKFNFSHDETRGCLYDLRAMETGLPAALNQPKLCKECVKRLQEEHVPDEAIAIAQRELKQVRKILYYRVLDLIKKYPIRFLVISILLSITSNITCNLIASYMYDYLQKH